VILTQDLCAVCAVSSGELASACPVDAEVISLDPRTLAEVAETVRVLAARLGAPERGDELASRMQGNDRERGCLGSRIAERRVFFAEWIEPPFCSGALASRDDRSCGGVVTSSALRAAVTRD
jgi:iron complex transport system substrate-binding protein